MRGRPTVGIWGWARTDDAGSFEVGRLDDGEMQPIEPVVAFETLLDVAVRQAVELQRHEAMRELVIRVANQRPCVLRERDPQGPTCASPVTGEGRPRDRWCYSCEARDIQGRDA
ncbi:MAG: hypothetical protein WD556_11510 [Actinomycetota bacterium]